ncbi:hypothetical protein CVT25_011870 [Psilocybe cyanescens]|uniref:Uncharacterized protein n=1 Tax=Psilocybe cyanescens TaxID=93625 RepID=A0A409WJ02_PSICY|nr:hypothetical protein CVT25_011870 [Psilocybe cyanescens]
METHSVAYSGIPAFKTQQTPYYEDTKATYNPAPHDVSMTRISEKSDNIELEANMPDGSVLYRPNLVFRFISHLLTYYAITFLSQFISISLCINGIASSSRKADRESGGFMVLCLLSFMVYLPVVDMAASYRKKDVEHYISARFSFLISIFSVIYILLDPSSMYRSPVCANATNLGGIIDDRCTTATLVLLLKGVSVMTCAVALFMTRRFPVSDPTSQTSSIYRDRRAQGTIIATIFYMFLTYVYRHA